MFTIYVENSPARLTNMGGIGGCNTYFVTGGQDVIEFLRQSGKSQTFVEV